MKRKNYLVHDEGNIAREGDIVRIEACRPLSASKHFAIAEIRKNKGSQFAKYDEIAKQQVLIEENEKTKEFLSKRERTETEIKENSSLISDLSLIHKGATTPEGSLSEEDTEKILKLKEKYGIKSWPPQSEALQLEIQSLKSKVDSLREVIDFVEPTLEILLQDQHKEKVDEVLKEFTKKEPETLKKNIRKNLLRKYLLNNPEFAKEDFGDIIESVKRG
jgi:small subunit ribosomal protein S17